MNITPTHIRENMIAYMRLFAEVPGMVVHDAPTFWIVSGKSAPGNVILRAGFSTKTTEERIDATLRQVGRLIDQIDWLVFPGDEPADLDQRLEARGMPGKLAGNWLWADLTQLGAAPEVPVDFQIRQVRDDAGMAEWVRLSEAGFGGELGWFYDAYARHGYSPQAFSMHYTGYLGDTPVTTGTLLDAGGRASIYDVSTPPEFRRRGFGGALTHALMREMLRRGHTATWIWSSDMAKGVYQRLGYRDIDFGIREHTWRSS